MSLIPLLLPLAFLHASLHACRPDVVDTPELRAAFVRQLLMSAFELDGHS